MGAQIDETPWQVRAACRGPNMNIFYPPTATERKRDQLRREELAKAICARCDVRQECLDYAIRIREPHGIWGGLTERERRVLL